MIDLMPNSSHTCMLALPFTTFHLILLTFFDKFKSWCEVQYLGKQYSLARINISLSVLCFALCPQYMIASGFILIYLYLFILVSFILLQIARSRRRAATIQSHCAKEDFSWWPSLPQSFSGAFLPFLSPLCWIHMCLNAISVILRVIVSWMLRCHTGRPGRHFLKYKSSVKRGSFSQHDDSAVQSSCS